LGEPGQVVGGTLRARREQPTLKPFFGQLVTTTQFQHRFDNRMVDVFFSILKPMVAQAQSFLDYGS